MTPHVERWRFATVCVAVAVLAGTLAPFNFTTTPLPSLTDVVPIPVGRDLSPDIFGNVVLFLPFGFALAGYLRQQWNGLATFTLVLLAATSFSFAIEVLQAFLPGRFTSLSDVFANTAGGGGGFLFYSLWREENPHLLFAAYMIPVCLASIPLRWNTTLHNWDPSFPLTVGNEHTGDRPWHGRVFEVMIFTRAMSTAQVDHTYRVRKPPRSMADSLVAWYDLSAGCPCADLAGQSPPLVATSGRARATERVPRPASGSWSETVSALRSATTAIAGSSAFTILVTAATDEANQTGAARIVSLSADPSYRNFTIAQDGMDLIFRLRTPLTGRNGSEPPLPIQVPAVFSNGSPQHLAFTYDGWKVRIYVNGTESARPIRLGVGSAALVPLLGRTVHASYGLDVLFYLIVFIPAGVLIAVSVGTVPAAPAPRVVLCAVAVASPLVFDAVLAAAAGSTVDPSTAALGILFAGAGVAGREHTIAQRRPAAGSNRTLLHLSGRNPETRLSHERDHPLQSPDHRRRGNR